MAVQRRGSFSFPRKWSPTQVPNFPVEVDTTHPLAQGLIALFIPGHNLLDLTQTNSSLTAAGTFAASWRGQAIAINGSTSMDIATVAPALQIQAGTLSYFGQLLSQPANDVALFTVNLSNNPYVAYAVTYLTSQTEVAMVYNTGVYEGVDIGAYNSFQSSVIAVFSAGTSSMIGYLDGAQAVSSALTPGAIGYSPGPISINLGGDARAVNSLTIAGMIHNQELIPNDVEWLNAEPFIMLRPLVRRQYYGRQLK
jgi:hypothetical protein